MICCPACGWPTSRVLDSRDAPNAIRRRRRCLRCETTWATLETVEISSDRRVRIAGRLTAQVPASPNP
ncbi:hypothetical protein [Methylorubrum populi]|uniref:NrdR family transcriptional regulator n=1 Tax=Methylorubrum populi TaxID=223967 RepID=UPI003D78CA00